jgi:hypothetical protein
VRHLVPRLPLAFADERLYRLSMESRKAPDIAVMVLLRPRWTALGGSCGSRRLSAWPSGCSGPISC